MIKAAAIRHNGNVYIGKAGNRHTDIMMEHEIFDIDAEMGFVTDKGEFLSRSQAALHAYECGQVSELKGTINTEDLW